jgi:hypothetical protein
MAAQVWKKVSKIVHAWRNVVAEQFLTTHLLLSVTMLQISGIIKL